MQKKVDFLLKNARICTVDEQLTEVDCLVVDAGKVVEPGSAEILEKKYQAKTTLDAGGSFVYPGFYDAHCHFYGYGTNLLQYANLTGAKTKDEIKRRLQDHYRQYPGEWLLGQGWDQNLWPDKQFPDKADLDDLFPNVPVFLLRIDVHAAWCNSKALDLAGITGDTKVEGGEVLMKHGAPTGILLDQAEKLVSCLIPKLSKEQKQQALMEAQKQAFAVGLTSVADCGLDREIVRLMDELQQADQLKVRINAMIHPNNENLDEFVHKGIYKTNRLHVNTIKLFADGALGSRGALLLDDYSDDPGNSGLQLFSTDYLRKMCRLAFDNNFQVATHAIGDGANRLVLAIYAELLKEKNDRRWRIEHTQIIHPNDLKKFAEFSIIPSIQALQATSDLNWSVNRVGAERLQTAYAWQQLLQQNGWLANGTDFPIESINPLKTFYASVFRKDEQGTPKSGFQMENALSREQALRSITIWAAKASFEEQEKGSLEAGKWADFVLVDTDLMRAHEKAVRHARVLKTFISGEEVFSRESIP